MNLGTVWYPECADGGFQSHLGSSGCRDHCPLLFGAAGTCTQDKPRPMPVPATRLLRDQQSCGAVLRAWGCQACSLCAGNTCHLVSAAPRSGKCGHHLATGIMFSVATQALNHGQQEEREAIQTSFGLSLSSGGGSLSRG